MRVVVFPAYRENPFLGLLLSGVEASGHSIVDARSVDELERALGEANEETVISLHWTNPIAQATRNPLVAARRAVRFAVLLRRAKRDGARVVWTVHNVLPHGARHRWLERLLHRFLVRYADLIHVMHPDTGVLVRHEYRLPPSRVRCVPHPSYVGAVPPAEDRETARARLGIGPREAAVLFLGQMRAYKGVLELIAAAGEASRPSGLVLLLAGNATPEEEAAIDAALAQQPALRAVRELRFVADADLPRWFAAADVMALPYRGVLNSGSAMLAATYGIPVLLPRQPHLERGLGERGWITMFDTGPGLRAALETVPLLDGDAQRAALDHAASWTGAEAGAAYLAVLTEARALR